MPSSFLLSPLKWCYTFAKNIFLTLEAQKLALREAIRQINPKEADNSVIRVVQSPNNIKQNIFCNRSDYLALFVLLEELLESMEQKWYISEEQKQKEVANVIRTIPNNLCWLISIYCVAQGEQHHLTKLWKKYAKTVVVLYEISEATNSSAYLLPIPSIQILPIFWTRLSAEIRNTLEIRVAKSQTE